MSTHAAPFPSPPTTPPLSLGAPATVSLAASHPVPLKAHLHACARSWAGRGQTVGGPAPIIAPPPRCPVLCRPLSSPPGENLASPGTPLSVPCWLKAGRPHPAGRADPGTDGGSATTGQEWVGDTASGLPGRREPWLPLCTSPILDPKSCAVAVPASGLGCLWEVRVVWAFRMLLCAHVCIFVGLQMGVCGGGVGRGSSLAAARGGLGTRPGCLCKLALVTGSPANPDPGRVPYVVTQLYIHILHVAKVATGSMPDPLV